MNKSRLFHRNIHGVSIYKISDIQLKLPEPYSRFSVAHQKVGLHGQSKLKLLVPSIGTFFTRLPLVEAFKYQDRKRSISSRRFVPPSFNDIRLILNTAQLMGVTNAGHLDLATFDGDVTL
jgi:IMP and pyridine-specific 5'-nucleotidase